VRDLGEAARFEHAEAGRDHDVLPVGIRDLDRLETRFEAPAYDACHQDGANSRAKGYRDDGTDLVQTLASRLVRCVGLLQDRLAPCCVTGLHCHFTPGLHESEQGKRW
jgi:hypothetical protein